MSAGNWLVASVMAHLDENPALAPLRLFDFVPSRFSYPWAHVEDASLSAIDGAGVRGRVGTLAIQCRDAGERPTRLRTLVARLEEQMEALDPDLGEGWRLGGCALAGSRIVRGKDEWVARSVWAVRVFRVN
ncbi:MAG: hypothetical protein JWN21_1605 [Sphingomonas bacterium]|uniref:tail completion protein gp17 n=1 Tax=Sphingomonas bacterium TaxID=1895847 RepID=UPI002618FF01|nr:DUF3168 domain-containing protein [Sphingomonas bacterium]MDB5696062.1 hypothetical protein [Sphingomonas bacterium]